MFTEAFMIRAFLAALFLCPLCALMGVFVTARRMSFFSETIAHGALAGVAIGIWMGMTQLTIPVIVFGLLVASAIIWLKENTELMTDTIMALLLAGSISLGIFVLSQMSGGYMSQVHGILFGDIMVVGNQDVVVAGVLLAIIALGIFRYLNVLTLMSAHEDLAHVCGVNVRRANYLFVMALTVTVAVTIQLLGIMLVTSLVVIPPAAARNVSCNLRQQIVYSLLIGVIGGLGGIALSYHFNAPCGATIAMSCIALFLLTLVIRLFTRNRNANQPLPS
jgi:zinc transport system permease protein